ncbi:MAG TPA: rod shape-determining protein MreD [Ignavibacteriales bacterium]|jgi:rod shape-determining protein MreD|nr:rod shape-determining protein MreD [Ignavibacteriales bacterium]
MKYLIKNNLYIFLATLICFILQVIVAPIISIYNITPDFLLILVIIYSTLNNQTTSFLFAFFVGLLIDLYLSSNIGIQTLSYLIASFVASYFNFNSLYYIKQFIYKFLFSLFISGICASLSILLLTKTIYSVYFFSNFMNFVVYSNIYNVIIAYIIITLIPGKRLYESI